jgi:hypothetical protein
MVIVALASGQGFLKAISVGVGTWGVAGLISRPVRLAIPSKTGTVGRLADHLLLANPRLLKPEGAPWSRAQILEVVLAAVKGVYDLEEAGERTPLDRAPPDSAQSGV